MEQEWRATGIVTFLSDYGIQDSYVAQVKGVMLARHPGLTIVDISHLIPAQDILEGAFQLATCWRVYPSGTVHLAVVDPGVGTSRRPVAVLADAHLFVLPDNGLVTFVLEEARSVQAWSLDRSEFFRHPVSATFHGRDIFGPVAAALASGTSPERVGSPVDPATLARLLLPALEVAADGVRGPIVSIDHFGNARTLIRPEHLPAPPERLTVTCGSLHIQGISRTFGDVEPGQPVAYFGSHGGLELAVRNGNAAQQWHLVRGMLVEVRRVRR
ncbi:SAM-dependent chlorinase/fluorinase [Thermomicrobium sp. 4228-Ro]|uniref:SAM hydrolase/SAM-dependent halogenase family protein n=1 Tax=Thermomicrobium sp. 4228-Ro TaxID=2993937 RepID=UPI002248DBF6|nr:SAM-dependent chlorinase/fluorinase [Thermomicrobium sp. 4228-Ro]MCX2726502.1 SAM-dependent chlorinase/fluorinase [Thermomicrobium sp. 4228-Ro]